MSVESGCVFHACQSAIQNVVNQITYSNVQNYEITKLPAAMRTYVWFDVMMDTVYKGDVTFALV